MASEPTMIYAVLILFYLFIAAFAFLQTRSLFHPTVVHAASWLVPVGWHWAYSSDLTPISPRLGILLIAATVAFTLPFLLFPTVPGEPPRWTSRFPVGLGLKALLTAVFLLPVASAVLAVRLLGSASAFSLALLRESFVAEEKAPSIGIGVIYPLVLGALFFVQHVKVGRVMRVFALVSASAMAVLSTSKIYFFILIFVVAVPPLLEAPGRLVLKRLTVLGSLGLVMFMALHLALGKFIGAGEVSTSAEMYRAAFLTLAIYFGGSISALDLELQLGTAIPDGYLFSDLPWLGRLLEAPAAEGGKILPFVFVPEIGTNVFGGYAPVLHELGPVGVILFMYVLGLVYCVLHARRSLPGGRFLFSFSLFPLIFLFHNEFFVMSVNQWVGFVAVSWALALALRPATAQDPAGPTLTSCQEPQPVTGEA